MYKFKVKYLLLFIIIYVLLGILLYSYGIYIERNSIYEDADINKDINNMSNRTNAEELDIVSVVDTMGVDYEDSSDIMDLDGVGIVTNLEKISNIYGIDVSSQPNIEDKIDILYNSRGDYGVDYRLKLLACINYNTLYGSGRDYTIEFGVLLGEIKKEYLSELDKVHNSNNVREETTTTMETSTESTTLDFTGIDIDGGVDSMTGVINELSRSVTEDSGSLIGETYEIWKVDSEGNYYKTTGIYEE